MTIGSHAWEGLTLAGGRYRITAKLGEGGMGFVYRALDQNIDADVVIKVPRQAMMDDPEFAGRFTREIRSLVKLSHPHIVKVTDVGSYEGTPFAVLQYLAGGSLEDQRTDGAAGRVVPWEPGQVSRWLIAIAEALDYIHSQGYVHRDVKPGNILFDTLGHAFLSDFGVAKVLASSKNAPPSQTAMTGAGMVLGTPEYMAPELIMGEPFDGRADQYALAITVYEMLCGRRPFEHETKTKVLVLHTSKAPPPLTQWCPALPDLLSRVVLKGLAKDPAERYGRCAEFARAIAAAAEGVGARDNRVRLRCSACGKTAAMSAADYTKLRESGRRATCPACKSPIDASNAVHATGSATPGGTMKFSIPGDSGEQGLTSARGPTDGATAQFTTPGSSRGEHPVAHAPQPGRSGTMALSASEGQKPPPLPAEWRAATPRQGSGTLVERTLPRSDEAAVTAVFTSLTGSDPGPLGSATQMKTAAAGPSAAAIPAWIWAAVGAGATVLLLLVGVIFSRSGARQETAATVGQAAPKPAIVGSEPESAAPLPGQLSGSAPPQASPAHAPASTTTELASAAEPAKSQGSSPTTSENKRPDAPLNSGGESSNPGREGSAVDAQPAPLVKKVIPAADAKKVAPAPTAFADGRFDVALLRRKPASAAFTLEKLIQAARSYSDQIVVPTGMYNLAPAQADRTGGPRKWMATERRVGPTKDSSELELSLAPSSVLELEPKLASRMDELEIDKWKDRVSILTVWVSSDGVCGLVKVEILEKAIPTIRKVGYTHKGFVEYETLLVTSEGSKPAKGDVEQWEKVGRMNWVAHQYKKKVEGAKRILRDNEQGVLSAQMNTMFGEMMKNAAVAEQQQRQLQQRLMSPR